MTTYSNAMALGKRLFVLSFLLFFFACGSDPEPSDPDSEFLVSSQDLNSFDVRAINNALSAAGINFFDGMINNPIRIVKIVYKTTFQGDEIEASGLVVLPLNVNNAPIVSAQHGTITANDEAPSNFSIIDGQISYFELFSANGFITFIPDYIGYGESSNLLHPYFLEEPTAQSVIDMIRAGIEFLEMENISFDDRLFLFGYSEGGYATLATQKAIEGDSALNLELDLEAVSAGAGGYYINAVLDSVLSGPTFPEPAFLAFVVHAYNTYLDAFGKPLTEYFQEPYASRIPNLFNGGNSIDAINNQLTMDLDSLFVPELLDSLRMGTQMTFRAAFEGNSVHNFPAKTQMRLYHSQEDEVIPPGTTLLAADTLRSLGTANIETIIFSGGTHFQAGVRTGAESLGWFSDLK